MHVRMYVCMCVNVYMYLCTYVRTYVCMYVCDYACRLFLPGSSSPIAQFVGGHLDSLWSSHFTRLLLQGLHHLHLGAVRPEAPASPSLNLSVKPSLQAWTGFGPAVCGIYRTA